MLALLPPQQIGVAYRRADMERDLRRLLHEASQRQPECGEPFGLAKEGQERDPCPDYWQPRKPLREVNAQSRCNFPRYFNPAIGQARAESPRPRCTQLGLRSETTAHG